MVKCGPPRRYSPTPDGSVKKALLVGIEYRNWISDPDYRWNLRPLRGEHRNTKAFAELLKDKYGYSPENIVMLLDEDEDMTSPSTPTKHNILREIHKLVDHAQSGDHFVFYFSGHSYFFPMDGLGLNDEQQCELDIEEQYECIVPVIPTYHGDEHPTEMLTAIFDAGRSGTMLDLNHYMCNNVYYPWISPGYRRQKTLWRVVRRKNGIDEKDGRSLTKKTRKFHTRSSIVGVPDTNSDQSGSQIQHHVIFCDQSAGQGPRCDNKNISVAVAGANHDHYRSFTVQSRPIPPKRRATASIRSSSMLQQLLNARKTTMSPLRIVTVNTQPTDRILPDGPICASPTNLLVCDGWCEKPNKLSVAEPAEPDVISIAACRSPQQLWETNNPRRRKSFTDMLIAMLWRLAQALTFQLQKTSQALHRWSEKKTNEMKTQGHKPWVDETRDAEIAGEFANFMEPQIGSLRTLTLQEPFDL
ncbi:caspase domain-containing protein [Trametes gibbosa]|nr:caspase domain-containing protein [Trametes gibbosa]